MSYKSILTTSTTVNIASVSLFKGFNLNDCTNNSMKRFKMITYRPDFVIIISVPNSLNLSHKSLVSKWHSTESVLVLVGVVVRNLSVDQFTSRSLALSLDHLNKTLDGSVEGSDCWVCEKHFDVLVVPRDFVVISLGE